MLVGSLLATPSRPLETAHAIITAAWRMNAMVNNRLTMARLRSGAVRFSRRWQPVAEVVGSALQSVSAALFNHTLRIGVKAQEGQLRAEPAPVRGSTSGGRFFSILPLGTPPTTPGPEEGEGTALPGPS